MLAATTRSSYAVGRQQRADVEEPGVAAERPDGDVVERLVVVPERVVRVVDLEQAVIRIGDDAGRPARQRIARVERQEEQIADRLVDASSAASLEIAACEDRDLDGLGRRRVLGAGVNRRSSSGRSTGPVATVGAPPAT